MLNACSRCSPGSDRTQYDGLKGTFFSTSAMSYAVVEANCKFRIRFAASRTPLAAQLKEDQRARKRERSLHKTPTQDGPKAHKPTSNVPVDATAPTLPEERDAATGYRRTPTPTVDLGEPSNDSPDAVNLHRTLPDPCQNQEEEVEAAGSDKEYTMTAVADRREHTPTPHMAYGQPSNDFLGLTDRERVRSDSPPRCKEEAYNAFSDGGCTIENAVPPRPPSSPRFVSLLHRSPSVELVNMTERST